MIGTARHLFRRQQVRLKGWLTLGSIGIVPRLVIAFGSVIALAATANLIVENGVAIIERQRDVALERSAQDSQQINTLRESMGHAKRAAMSASLLSAASEFDRATQEHAADDSHASAKRFFSARSALDQGLSQFLAEDGQAASALPRLVNEHKRNADALVQARRYRRELLTKYSGLLTGLDLRVRESI